MLRRLVLVSVLLILGSPLLFLAIVFLESPWSLDSVSISLAMEILLRALGFLAGLLGVVVSALLGLARSLRRSRPDG